MIEGVKRGTGKLDVVQAWHAKGTLKDLPVADETKDAVHFSLIRSRLVEDTVGSNAPEKSRL